MGYLDDLLPVRKVDSENLLASRNLCESQYPEHDRSHQRLDHELEMEEHRRMHPEIAISASSFFALLSKAKEVSKLNSKLKIDSQTKIENVDKPKLNFELEKSPKSAFSGLSPYQQDRTSKSGMLAPLRSQGSQTSRHIRTSTHRHSLVSRVIPHNARSPQASLTPQVLQHAIVSGVLKVTHKAGTKERPTGFAGLARGDLTPMSQRDVGETLYDREQPQTTQQQTRNTETPVQRPLPIWKITHKPAMERSADSASLAESDQRGAGQPTILPTKPAQQQTETQQLGRFLGGSEDASERLENVVGVSEQAMSISHGYD